MLWMGHTVCVELRCFSTLLVFLVTSSEVLCGLWLELEIDIKPPRYWSPQMIGLEDSMCDIQTLTILWPILLQIINEVYNEQQKQMRLAFLLPARPWIIVCYTSAVKLYRVFALFLSNVSGKEIEVLVMRNGHRGKLWKRRLVHGSCFCSCSNLWDAERLSYGSTEKWIKGG